MSKKVKREFGPMVMHFDGCSRQNPGPSGAGWVLSTPEGKGVACGYEYIGDHETNNVAEYRALIGGLHQVEKLGVTELRVFGDSKLVCEQVKGNWKCNPEHLKLLLVDAKAGAKRFKSFKIGNIPRENNKVADFLSNCAVDFSETKNFEQEFDMDVCSVKKMTHPE